MKTLRSSKQTGISSENELLHHFRQLTEVDPDLQWRISPQALDGRSPWVDLGLDDHFERFKPVYLLRASILELQSLVATWTDPIPPLVVVPELPARLLEHCRGEKLAVTDLNGRVYVRRPGLLIDRRALPGRAFRFLHQPRNIFVGKSACIIRTLLTDRDRLWHQGELLERSHASPGLVSRIVQHLVTQGFIEKCSTRQFRLSDPFGLLDAWAKADDFARRATTARYNIFVDNPFGIARELQAWAQAQSVPIAFTQWLAAWLRHPYTEPVIVSAYVARLPEPDALSRFGLRPVPEAGKVWLHVPQEPGVFLETRPAQELAIVTDAQIYLDLQQTGLRGPEQAAALRNWEGFCRP